MKFNINIVKPVIEIIRIGKIIMVIN